jgi:signal transduction histidine kinase/DNA-binding NarL/FixJ family response regulator
MPDADRPKILVVDDVADTLLTYRVILEELGQEIVYARSGSEALKQVLQHEFAVILLDVNMPDMDGFETAALIRRRKRSAHTPIIFVTAYADEVQIAEGYAHGAVDYILAPVVPEVLRAKVRVFVDLFRMTQQVKRQAQEQIALTEERSRREAAEEANRNLSFLARAGAIMGQSLDFDETARDIARLSVPSLADHAILTRPEPQSRVWAVTEAREQNGLVAVQELAGFDHLSATWTGGMSDAFAAGELQASGPANGSAGSPNLLQLPLRARGRTLGVLLLSREASGRQFSPSDITVAESIASRAAFALDNARLYKEVEQADRQKNEFLSMLAHELRNPLAPIRNAVTFMRMSGEVDPDVEWARELIDRQVTHLVRLVDDLLDVSRITRGKIRLEMDSVDLQTVVASAVETSRPLMEAASHHFSLQTPEYPLWVTADQARLSQVLSNLLNNAAKYTPERGNIRLSARREGDHAVVEVSDNGMGIPADMIGKVFELFTQVDRSLDRSQGGLGIGLTLVKRLVEMHGGSVAVASEGPGRGSTFSVRLPLAAAPRQIEASDDAPTLASSSLKVLVVDDNIGAAESLARLLTHEGHQTRLAYDGASALDMAGKFKPQVVVLDLGLPEVDGYEVARRLKTDPATSDMLLLAVSGYGQEEDLRRSNEVGFRRHFIKPLDFSALLQLLAQEFPAADSELCAGREEER